MIRSALLVLALTSTAGAAPWTFKMYPRSVDAIAGSATDDVLFVATKASVAALDATGKELFRWSPDRDKLGCRNPLMHLAAMTDGSVAAAFDCPGGAQAMIAVLSARGEERWRQTFDTAGIHIRGLAALPNAELVVSMDAWDRVTATGFPAPPKGAQVAYLARFDKRGTLAWARGAELAGPVTASDGDLVVAGSPKDSVAWVERWSGEGKLRWKHELLEKKTFCDRIISVSVVARGDIVGAGNAGSPGAVEPCFFRVSATGEPRWLVTSTKGASDILTTAEVLGDTLYFAGYLRTGSGGNRTDRLRGTIGLDGKGLAIDRIGGTYSAEGVGITVMKGAALIAEERDDGMVYLEPLAAKP